MQAQIQTARSYSGSAVAPGDKSISHRALIFAALAETPCQVDHLGPGADVRSTAACLRALGVTIDIEGEHARVVGNGLGGLRPPSETLDCGNSGTTMRLLTGVLAGAGVGGALDGDESLRKRPMRRVLDPVRRMGAEARGQHDERDREVAPLRFTASQPLRGCRHDLEVASAQVKSCILLAGLWAEGRTTVHEPFASRDHTERMLQAFGAAFERHDELTVSITRGQRLELPDRLQVAGDPSSAAFLLAPALLVRGARVTVEQVGINPTRAGFLRVVQRMSPAGIDVGSPIDCGGEPLAAVTIRDTGPLLATDIGAAEIPSLIDEVPLVAILATQARGRTTIRGAAELRVKESDRLATVSAGLRAMGASVEELPDGLVIEGPQPLHGATIDSAGDHRIAMCFTVAGLVASGETRIEGAECAAISFPSFYAEMTRLSGGAVKTA